MTSSLNRNSHNPLGTMAIEIKKTLLDNPESLTVFNTQILMVSG